MKHNSIQIDNITKNFDGKKPIFKNSSMYIKGGDFAFITGKSGSGKSTLLKIIHHIEKVDRGIVIIGGDSFIGSKVSEIRQNIGFVFQDYRLLDEQTVTKNIRIPLYIRGLKSKEISWRIKKTSKNCGIEHLLDQKVSSLSGGEKQLVTLARASIANPTIILADEPTANLDNESARKVLNLLEIFHSKGHTVLIATHDLSLISSRKANIFLIKERYIKKVAT